MLGNLGKPGDSNSIKTGFRLISMTKASPKKAPVVGEIAGGNKLITLRGGKGITSANPMKRRKKAMY